VIVPVTGLPPATLPGLKLRAEGTTDALAGLTTTAALCVKLL